MLLEFCSKGQVITVVNIWQRLFEKNKRFLFFPFDSVFGSELRFAGPREVCPVRFDFLGKDTLLVDWQHAAAAFAMISLLECLATPVSSAVVNEYIFVVAPLALDVLSRQFLPTVL